MLDTRTMAITTMNSERQRKNPSAYFCRSLILALRRMIIGILTTAEDLSFVLAQPGYGTLALCLLMHLSQ